MRVVEFDLGDFGVFSGTDWAKVDPTTMTFSYDKATNVATLKLRTPLKAGPMAL